MFPSNGLKLAFVDYPPLGPDRGEPILLVHGFASNVEVNWSNTFWIRVLREDGRRVIAFDNRGHGHSEKCYNAEDYTAQAMAHDALNLLDHLRLKKVDVMGYSMGARIAAFLTLAAPARIRSLIMGGLGDRLVNGIGLPMHIAEALEAPSLAGITDPMQRLFRSFAENTGSDLRALAACIRGSRQFMTREEIAAISCPVLIAVGTKDDIAGDPHALAALMENAKAFDVEGRDHTLATGDKSYKREVLSFLQSVSAAAP
jgi:pimeloyl-ACP methyl ester carboxylesterase